LPKNTGLSIEEDLILKFDVPLSAILLGTETPALPEMAALSK
jgi:hypothetical protein